MDNRYTDRGADLQPEQQPSWPSSQASWQEAPVYDTVTPSQPTKQKKNRRGLKLTALALALVLLGGLSGGAVTSWMLGRQQTAGEIAPAETAVQTEEAAPAERTIQETVAEAPAQTASDAPEETGTVVAAPAPRNADTRTVLPLIAGDETVVKTPAEIYASCVESVVSIKNNVTTNVFGQPAPPPAAARASLYPPTAISSPTTMWWRAPTRWK